MAYKLNQQHIKDLREGQITLDNKDIYDLSLLNQILKEAFPKDVVAGGGSYFYTRSTNNQNAWMTTSDNRQLLPSIKTLDFIEKEVFVLPKKWCLKYEGDDQEVLRYFGRLKGVENFYLNVRQKWLVYFHSSDNGNGISNEYVHEGYTEITFEQFKKYVLKETVMEEKIDKVNDEFIVDCTNYSKQERQRVYAFLIKNRGYSENYSTNHAAVIVCNKTEGDSNYCGVVGAQSKYSTYPVYRFKEFKDKYLNYGKVILGYKAPFDMYEGKLKEGTLVKQFPQPHMNKAYGIPAANGFFDQNILIPKEIATTWETVYEEKKLPKINGYDGKIVTKGNDIYVQYGCAEFHSEWLKAMAYHNTGPIDYARSQFRTAVAIKLDSGVTLTIEQIREIVDFLKQ